MSALDRTYALADPEGGYWSYARCYSDTVLHVNGQPAKPRDTQGAYQDWWWSEEEPVTLQTIGPPTKETVAYRLPEGVSIPDQPAELTPAEWRERFEDFETSSIGQLYRTVQEDRPPKVIDLPAPVMLLPGAPPPDDERRWVVEMPFEIREHQEYRHLFPGHIPGFKAALHEHLGGRGFGCGQVAGVDCHEDRESRALRVERLVIYSPTLTTWRKKPRGRGKEQVPRTVRRTLLLLVPDSVKGPNRAEATERWDALWAKAMELVDASNVKACGHCEGRGWQSDGPGENGERVVLWNEMGWAE